MEKHKKQKELSGDVIMGFVLLNCPEIGEQQLAQEVRKELGDKVKIESQRDKLLTWQLDAEEFSFWCACMPFPIPEGEVERMTACNMLSQEDAEAMAAHKGFLIVRSEPFAPERKKEACMLFNRLCGGILKLEETVGMYMGGAGLLIGKERYFRQLEIIYSQAGREEAYFPVPLWIRLFLYQEKGRKSAETSGLREFGFPEVCLYNTSLPPEEVIPCLYLVAMEEITGQTVYQDKDLIRLEDDRKAVCKQEGEILYIIGT